MKMFTAIIEKCPDTDLYVGYVPNFPGAHFAGRDIGRTLQNLPAK